MKKIALTLLFLLVCSNYALADMKYTIETETRTSMPGMGAMGMFPGMPNMGMMNPMMGQQPSQRRGMTIYVKGNRKRVDDLNNNTSQITICNEQKVIKVNHNNRSFIIIDMNKKLQEMDQTCKQMKNMSLPSQEEFSTKIQDNNQNMPPQYKNSGGPLTMITTITDTGEEEMLGDLRARHYIKDFEVSGNPNCMPDMKNREHIWTTNFTPEEIQCPVITNNCFKQHPYLLKRPQTTCFQNTKIITNGLKNIPGFVVKTEQEMNMGNMMGMMKNMAPQDGEDMADMQAMAGMFGQMKTTSYTYIRGVSRDILPDSVFEVPQGYTQNNNFNDQQVDMDDF